MNRGRVTQRPQATNDLLEHAFYIADTSLDASDRFLRAAEEAFQHLAEMPGMGSSRDFGNPALAGLRMWPVPGFRKHLIFYFPRRDGIEVVRVLHASRDLANLFEAEVREDSED